MLRSRLLFWLAVVGAVVVMFSALAVIGSTSLHAQTATPTATVTPYSLSPTRTPMPTPVASSPYIWGCRVFGSVGGSPVCTWGDYFEVEGAAYSSGDGVVYEPGSSTANDVIFLWPASDTRAITATCSYIIDAYTNKVSSTVPQAASYATFVETNYWDMTVDGAAVTTDYTVGQIVSNNESYGVVDTVSVAWRLKSGYAAWPTYDPSDMTYANRANFARFGGRAYAGTGSDERDYASGYYRVACQIDWVERLDGSTFVPLDPTTLVPTPTPEGVGFVPWPTPIGWTRVPTQTVIGGDGLTITPGATTCYELLPSFSTDGVTVFGISVPAWSMPEFEVCLAENEVGLTVMGWNLGALALAAAALGVGGAFYFMIKQG